MDLMFAFLLFLAIIPVIILLKFIYYKDKNKEPKKLLSKIFFLGFLSAIPVLICELSVGNLFPYMYVYSYSKLFFNVFCGVAIIEEFFKWIVVRWKGYYSREFDEVYDAIVYTVYASLGFACIENILFVLQNGVNNALLRSITSIPGHACFGVFMGYYFGLAKSRYYKNNKSGEFIFLFLSLIVPSLIHTLYDFLIFAGSDLFFIIWIIYTVSLFIVSAIIINKISNKGEVFFKNSINSISDNSSSNINEYKA